MSGLLYVALGGALGASGRYLLGGFLSQTIGTGFPWGTLAANVLGGFLMGILVAWLAFRVSEGENIRLFLGVGLLGGFTTFSAFSLETIRMMEHKTYTLAASYVSASVVFSLLAVFLGLALGRKILALP